jgi:hypothetical protein
MGKVQEPGHGGNVSFVIWDIHVKAIVKVKCQYALRNDLLASSHHRWRVRL